MAVQSKLRSMVGIIVAIVVSAILLAYVLPVGMNAMYDANTSAWGQAESQIFDIIPIFLILVPLLVIVGWAIWSFQS